MKAVNAKGFDMVAAWSVDRLGRSLTDLLGILQELQEKGSTCSFISKVSIRPTAGKAMFQMLDIAEFEREIIRIGTSVVQRVFKQEPRRS